ncbi:MAG: helix-turn-helix domain-containing protein [Fibrobacterota bacterium]
MREFLFRFPRPERVSFNLIFFILAFSAVQFTFAKGNADSPCRILTPEPFSVINDDWLKADVVCNENIVIDSVEFFMVYATLTEKKNQSWKIDTARVATGDHLFDLKNMRDMLVYIGAEVSTPDTALKIGYDHDIRGVPVVIDREKDFKKITHLCGICPDGIDTESAQSISEFTGQNNKVSFSSCRNSDSLFIRINVSDRNLNFRQSQRMSYGSKADYFKTMWYSDGLEICFDTEHNHSEWRTLRDYEYIINVGGEKQGYNWDPVSGKMEHFGEPEARAEVILYGTLNDNSDIDIGYTVEFAVSLDFLGLSTVVYGDTIGFDVQVFDLDSETGSVFRTIWSGTDFSNNDNTSEWGNMVFTGKKTDPVLLFLIILIPFFLVSLFIYKGGRKPEVDEDSAEKTEMHHIVVRACEYIEINFSSPKLGREELARYLNVSEPYLSTVFKKNTGKTLTDHINNVRIQKAKEILTSSEMSISEAAFATGYNTIQNFNKTFKKITGKSPSEYRKRV